MPELILYLEPAKNTPLRQCLDSILSTIACSYYLSTAIKYPIHVSATGFFTVDSQADVAFVIDTYDQLLSMDEHSSAYYPSPTIDLNPITVSNPLPYADGSRYSSKHLLLPITVTDEFRLQLHQCGDKINNIHTTDQPRIRQIRNKRIDHISLAYWDEPKATDKETNDWLRWSNGPMMEAMQRDIIQHLNEFQSSASLSTLWDMVLYERTHKGDGVGEKHVFQEWSRWRLK